MSSNTTGIVTKPQTLAGKVALVTGSGRGMGRQNALEFASRGASVVINYANSAGPAEEVVKEIKSLGREAIAIKADMSKPEEIEALFEETVRTFGKLDIVMSNSGTQFKARIAKSGSSLTKGFCCRCRALR